MVLRLIILFCLALVLSAQIQPGCTPSPEIDQILRPAKSDPSVDYPGFAWASYYLAVTYSFPRFPDNKQSAEFAASFLKSCPDFLPAYAYLSRVTSPELQRPTAAAFKIQGVPTNYVADPSATVRLEYIGFGGNGEDWIKQMLAALDLHKQRDNR